MRLWFALLTLHASTVAVACQGSAPEPATSSQSPARLPGVSVLDLDKHSVNLAELVRGRVALINLWATWCEACERELEALDRLQARLDRRAMVVGVAVGEPFDRVDRFVRRRGFRYPQLVDEEFRLADALGTERVPTTLVVDQAGQVRYSGGELDGAALEALREVIRD